jgi:hypothetical protein
MLRTRQITALQLLWRTLASHWRASEIVGGMASFLVRKTDPHPGLSQRERGGVLAMADLAGYWHFDMRRSKTKCAFTIGTVASEIVGGMASFLVRKTDPHPGLSQRERGGVLA